MRKLTHLQGTFVGTDPTSEINKSDAEKTMRVWEIEGINKNKTTAIRKHMYTIGGKKTVFAIRRTKPSLILH